MKVEFEFEIQDSRYSGRRFPAPRLEHVVREKRFQRSVRGESVAEDGYALAVDFHAEEIGSLEATADDVGGSTSPDEQIVRVDMGDVEGESQTRFGNRTSWRFRQRSQTD